MLVYLECPDCGHTWPISAEEVGRENGEEVIKVGIFDDICPICDTQGNVFDLSEDTIALVP